MLSTQDAVTMSSETTSARLPMKRLPNSSVITNPASGSSGMRVTAVFMAWVTSAISVAAASTGYPFISL